MFNDSIECSHSADQLLNALGEQLAARGESYTLAVVGGSAPLALGLISRPTRDVDVVAIVENHELVSAQPLPATLLHAAHTVARNFGLPDEWLNPRPTSLLDLGLPDGFYERVQHRVYNPGLEILFASHVDQIHLKLYATVDQGAGKHLTDLEALQPTDQELLDTARWSRSHDPSEGYLGVLKQVLTHFGDDSGNLDP